MPNPYTEREPRCTQEQLDTLRAIYRERGMVTPPICPEMTYSDAVDLLHEALTESWVTR